MTARKAARVARRLFRLCTVNGALDERRARLVVERVGASGRRGAERIVAEFLRQVRLDVARHTATVQSAVPLPDEIRARVRSGLATTYGPALATTFAVDPSLIGGMRIKVGSDVFDGSVRARLAELETSL